MHTQKARPHMRMLSVLGETDPGEMDLRRNALPAKRPSGETALRRNGPPPAKRTSGETDLRRNGPPAKRTSGETDPGETDPGETDPGETDPGETDRRRNGPPAKRTPAKRTPGETGLPRCDQILQLLMNLVQLMEHHSDVAVSH